MKRFALILSTALLTLPVFAGDEDALKYYEKAQSAFDKGHFEESKDWLDKALRERSYDGQVKIDEGGTGCVWQETPRGPRCIASANVRYESYEPNALKKRVESRLAALESEKRSADALRAKYANPPVLAVTGLVTGDGILTAKESTRFILTVENRGSSAADQVVVKAELPRGVSLDGNLNVGTLAPGDARSLQLELTGAKNLTTAQVQMAFKAAERDGFDSAQTPVALVTQEYMPPQLQIIYERVEQSGPRKLAASYTIVNSGQGTAVDVVAKLELPKSDIFLNDEADASVNIGDLAPNQSREVRFEFFANNRIQANSRLPVSVRLLENDPENNLTHPLAINMPAMGTASPVMLAAPVVPTVASPVAGILNVDIDIPKGSYRRDYGVALVIGNADYKTISRVDFAVNDARAVSAYARDALGFKRVDERHNMSSREMRRLFGSARDGYEGQLFKRVRAATQMQSNPPVFIYYSGHGAPSLNEQGGAYLVPTDIDNMHYIEDEGYSMKDFYAAVAKLPTNDVTVIIDSCFSGSGGDGKLLFSDISPAALKTGTSLPENSLQNAVVMTSASGDQVSNWYREGNHSLFTYHLLAGLRGKADRDQDSSVSMDELKKYVSYHVQDYVYANNITDQTPDVRGDMSKVLVKY